jgi:hypothetical protein
MASGLEVLWSQEAAGWAQAIGSFFALYITQRIASRESRDAAVARETRGMVAALSILQPLESWHRALGQAIPGSDSYAAHLHDPKIVTVRAKVPELVAAALPELTGLRTVSDPLLRAAYLSNWITRHRETASKAFHGSSLESFWLPDDKARVFMGVYRDNVVRLRALIQDAIEAIGHRFPDPNRAWTAQT